MLRQRFLWAAVAALAWGAAAASESRAQYVTAGPVSGYTSGSQIDRRPLVPVTAYPATTIYLPGYRGSMFQPIFMTSINYPGIYGDYAFGVANNSLYYREPMVYPRDRSAVVSSVSTTIIPPNPNQPPRPGVSSLRAGVPGTGTATIRVRVPAEARLYFEDELTAPTGGDRLFESPALEAGRRYRYDIRAVWNEEGREVVRTRSVLVRAGDRLDVDMTTAPAEEGPTLRARPMPAPAAARPATPKVPPAQSLSPARNDLPPASRVTPAQNLTPAEQRRRANEAAPRVPSGP